jgi:hypothetical protein
MTYQYFVCPKCGRSVRAEMSRCYEPNRTCTCAIDDIDSAVYQMVEVTDETMEKALERLYELSSSHR